LLEDCKKREG